MKMREIMIATVASLFAMAAGSAICLAESTADAFVVSDGSTATSVQTGMDGSAVTILYDATDPAAMPDSPSPTDILVGGSDPSNLFAGDLSAYSGLRFRVVGDGMQPSSIAVYIRRQLSNRIHLWHHPEVSVSGISGDWTVVRIPFDPNQGWIPSHTVGERYTLEESWNGTMADVDTIYVRIARDGHPAQTYSLADFQLAGTGEQMITEPARLSLVEDYFGGSNIDDIDRTIDTDGDGMSDYDELIAGLDPRNANSVFQARVERTTGGNVIRWPGVLGGRYAVMRSGNLIKGFSVLQADIQAGFTGTQQVTDEKPLEGGLNFYKVVKQ